MNRPNIVSRTEWLSARKQLLAKEKALTRMHDELALERGQLPWVQLDKDYSFDTADGKQSLAQLFRGKTQLVIYHFMFGPSWNEGCPSCSLLADHVDASLVHLAQRDVAFCAVSRAPYAAIAQFKQRMGWRFAWASSHDSDFNFDFQVSFRSQDKTSTPKYYNYESSDFPSDEAPGISVFCRDENEHVFHTYSSYGRGAEPLIGAYSVLDLVPKGRNEAGLPFPMAWVRHHDRYGA
jgi:predicted dithiol-disulfide oxidoreductase (DUF899 family)